MPKSSLPPTFRAARGLVPTFPRAEEPRLPSADLRPAADFDLDDDADRPAARVGVRRLDVDELDLVFSFDLDFDEEERARLAVEFLVDFLPDLPAERPPDLRDAMRFSFVCAPAKQSDELKVAIARGYDHVEKTRERPVEAARARESISK
jgi:hypothetical protein